MFADGGVLISATRAELKAFRVTIKEAIRDGESEEFLLTTEGVEPIRVVCENPRAG